MFLSPRKDKDYFKLYMLNIIGDNSVGTQGKVPHGAEEDTWSQLSTHIQRIF